MPTRAPARRAGCDDGASSVEYGLIVFAIAAVIALAVFALGPPVLGLYTGSCKAVAGGPAGAVGAPPNAC